LQNILYRFPGFLPQKIEFFEKKKVISEDFNICENNVISVRKTQHQNPEFGHTQAEIQKKTCKKVH
jgi:hypothetical protein